MQPNPITALGMRFKRAYLKRKQKVYEIKNVTRREAHRNRRIKSNDCNTSDICTAIRNIYEGDKNEGDKNEGERYKYFKVRMLKSCAKQPITNSIDELKKSFKETYTPLTYYDSNRVGIDYYYDSALASAIIYFNRIKSQTENPYHNDIFTNNYKRLNVSILKIEEVTEIKDGKNVIVDYMIRKNDAIDDSGPAKEFLTKFFEELFCDNQHPKRPFIQPPDNKEGKYYINPNFAPDEGFMKVIKAYNMKNAKTFKLQFKTETDYKTIYNIIGKVLSAAVVNDDIMVPKYLSAYILTGMIKEPKDITLYDLLYFYLCEFDNAIVYINMISKEQIGLVDDLGLSFNQGYNISNKDHELSKGNYCKFLLQLARHIITKNFLDMRKPNSDNNMRMRYKSLFAGFNSNLRTTLIKAKISVAEFESIITITELDEKSLKEFANGIRVEIRGTHTLTAIEKNIIISEMKLILFDIITKKKEGETDETHSIFIRKLLQFWSATTQLKIRNTLETENDETENAGYKILYFVDSDPDRFPQSHTCFNTIDFWGFPKNVRSFDEKKEFLYNKLQYAVFNTLGIDNQ